MEGDILGPALAVSIGTLEEARAMIGYESDLFVADIDVNWPMIKFYCALTEDANPSYWDEEFAKAAWGSIVSPTGMLMCWVYPIQWRPGGSRNHPLLALSVPLPGDTVLNVSTETEFEQVIPIGTRIAMSDKLIEVSDLKTTVVGPGHFVTTLATFTNSAGDVLARTRNVAFRYNAKPA